MDHFKYIASVAEKALYNPAIDYKSVVLYGTWAVWGIETYVLSRQIPYYHLQAPPPSLREAIPQETFEKAQSYSRDKARFAVVRQLYEQVVNWGTIWGGAYFGCWEFAGDVLDKVGFKGTGVITRSLVYATTLTVLSLLPGLPTSFYSTFVVEEKHGFNKSSIGLWVMDTVKGWLVGAVIGLPVLAAFLWIIQWAGDSFLLYLMVFFLVFQLSFQIIYPTFIQPLFNTLTPLLAGDLRDRVEALAQKLGFPLKHLYVIDGSKRSSHSNAYFYGLPWAKHIVIYDTLIEQSSAEEVEAVLAHELGHWSYTHPFKLLAIAQLHLFWTLSAFQLFIHNPALFSSFGFSPQIAHHTQPIVIGFLLFQLVVGLVDPLVGVGINAMTRKYEYEADKFACQLGPQYGPLLIQALIKLQNKNLASPHNDWLYSMWNHSHPTLLQRIERIEEYMGKGQGGLKLKEGKKGGREEGKKDL